METLLATLPYLRRHTARLVIGFFLLIASNLIILLPPLLLGQAIDALGRHAATGVLVRLALEIVGLAVASGALQFSGRYTIQSVSRYTEYEMRADLFTHFQRLDLAYFQHRKTGDLVARATNDLSAIRMMVGPGLYNLCNTVVLFTLTAIAMVRIEPRLTLYSLTVMPVITAAFIYLGERIRHRFRDVQDQFGEVSAQANENFSGIRTVKAYAQEDDELRAFDDLNHEYVRRSVSFARVNSLVWPVMTFVSGLAIAILLWRGGSEVIEGSLRLGQLVQFNTYLTALAFPMIGLGWSINLIQQGSASSARIQEVLTTAPAIADGALTREGFTPTRGEVEFRGVTLRYSEGPEVLHDVSFTVPAGGWLAIVGATGAGKTTIVNLIPRLFDVTGGQVLVDGVDVREIPLDALRRSVGYVPQETFLFSLSLEENVAFGMATPVRDRVDTAARVSQLAKDLEDFPQGIETVIGERGVTLSGGQKQRASIARAVARDPLVLILDDALSSVDTNTEAAILRGLHDVMRGRTTITIAHRVSTIRDADEILVLDAGRIAERGTHASLLAEGGLYAAMYRRQLLTEELSDDDEPDPGEPDPAEASDGLVD